MSNPINIHQPHVHPRQENAHFVEQGETREQFMTAVLLWAILGSLTAVFLFTFFIFFAVLCLGKKEPLDLLDDERIWSTINLATNRNNRRKLQQGNTTTNAVHSTQKLIMNEGNVLVI